MLRLKRVVHFNEFLKCKVSGEIISYGDYYYEDDEDGLIVKASVYKQLQREKQRERERKRERWSEFLSNFTVFR